MPVITSAETSSTEVLVRQDLWDYARPHKFGKDQVYAGYYILRLAAKEYVELHHLNTAVGDTVPLNLLSADLIQEKMNDFAHAPRTNQMLAAFMKERCGMELTIPAYRHQRHRPPALPRKVG